MSLGRAGRFRSGFHFLIVVAVLGGVSVGVSLLAEAKKGGGKRAPADNRDCKTDKDCVLVADDCCPCNQGGKARAIPKKQKDTYEKDRKKRCADTACTEMMSTDPTCAEVPFCGAGICELGEAPGAAKTDDAPKSDDPAKSEDKSKSSEKPKANEKPKSGEKPKADEKPSSGIEF
jgi:hypothetical protein